MNNIRFLPNYIAKSIYHKMIPDRNVLRKNKIKILFNFGKIDELTYNKFNYKDINNSKCIFEETYKLLKKK